MQPSSTSYRQKHDADQNLLVGAYPLSWRLSWRRLSFPLRSSYLACALLVACVVETRGITAWHVPSEAEVILCKAVVKNSRETCLRLDHLPTACCLSVSCVTQMMQCKPPRLA